MNNIFKIVLIPFCLFLLMGCSYQPVLKVHNFEYSVNIMEIIGDERVNEKLEDKFKKLENDKYKIYDLKLESETIKETISKDSKGDPTIFELVVIVNFKILSDGIIVMDKTIKRKNTYDNISDKWQLEQNELDIIENLTETIVDYITFSISKINKNDN